ncbi:hypothetical protein VFPFJ_00311 [Purpureocillium lilacinum]|uniref:Uncharacterized protein n=1 Tax=Purpureocillium lilacinum TaxID=33203 RepID=A0A179H9M8_PURLI|nr:hypothetical protein VFPFJ_00311 [Purpureocillium lilacinum]OAQ86241.1 hypothetical protein VFPBJ_00281 [Purpureocillium lilacinum]OAQ94202.1 hypothetical protein VFPFJ_00311 [Purpureocillium lilacinum]
MGTRTRASSITRMSPSESHQEQLRRCYRSTSCCTMALLLLLPTYARRLALHLGGPVWDGPAADATRARCEKHQHIPSIRATASVHWIVGAPSAHLHPDRQPRPAQPSPALRLALGSPVLHWRATTSSIITGHRAPA